MGKVIAALVVIIVVIIGGLSWVLSNPDRFKPEITALIEDQTGLKIRIDGELAWRLWPPVQLLVQDVAADWETPEDDPLFALAELRLDADLLPLLSANPRLTVDGVLIDGLRAKLVQTGDVANWTPPGMAGAPPPVPVPPPSESAIDSWQIASIRLNDAVIDYTVDDEHTRIDLASLTMTQLAPDTDIPLRAAAHVATADTETGVTIDANIRTNAQFDRWTISDAELTLADATLQLSAEVTDVATSPAATGRVDLAPQTFPELLALLEADIDGPVGASFNFNATEQQVQLTDLVASAYGSTVTGRLDYFLSAPGKRQRAEFALDVDSLLIEANDEAAAVTWAGPGALGLVSAAGASIDPADVPLLPLETLREIDWLGTVDIAKLIYDGAEFPNTRIETRNDAGRIDTTLNMPSFFGGSAATQVGIDARSDTPVWNIVPTLSDVKSEPLMTWMDQRLYWVAQLLLNGEFELRGNTERELLYSVAGRSRFDGGQGTMDITRLKRAIQVVAQLAGGSERINEWPERLQYQRFTGDWQVDGTRHVLDMALDNMLLAVNGTYDPLTDLMDMKVDLTIDDDPEIDTFQINSMLMGMAIPVRCKGPSTDPTCRADEEGVKKLMAAALTGQAGAETTERIDKAIEENVPEEHRDAARELLRGFGNLLNQSKGAAPEPQPEQP